VERPRTAVEEVLAGIWCEVLGREEIGLEDDFFGLGGHSLLATRVLSRIRTAFEVEIPVLRLFEAPNVAALAEAVEAARRERSGWTAPPLAPATRMASTEIPKLLVVADPGAILTGAQLERCRAWPAQTEVRVAGNHFIQEDSPHEIGEALASWIAGA
jgi:acyl carrier protein